MAKAPPDKKKARAQAREAYRRAYEERRAKQASRRGRTAKVPTFHAESYVHLLRMSSWASIHTILYSAALAATGIIAGRAAGSAAWGAFAALLCIGSLYYYLLRIWDIDLLKIHHGFSVGGGVAMGGGRSVVGTSGKPTSVIGVYITYFITWIMVSFLLSNPPFFDGAAPEIKCCGYYQGNVNNTSWVLVHGKSVNRTAGDPSDPNATNGTAMLEFGAYDNAAVGRVRLDISDPAGVAVESGDLPLSGNGTYRYVFPPLTVGSYLVNITAYDVNDHRTFAQDSLNVHA